MKRVFSIMISILLLASMLAVSFTTRNVEASGTIYIRADGSVEPPDAPIERIGEVYCLTESIASAADGIVVERDYVTLDGAGFAVQGSNSYGSSGVFVNASMVTVKNLTVTAFETGVYLPSWSGGNNISDNTITENKWGIGLWGSSTNTVSRNFVTANTNNGIDLREYSKYNEVFDNELRSNGHVGIRLDICSDYNDVYGNVMEDNWGGLASDSSSNNTIHVNNITANRYWGIDFSNSTNNRVYHNNFVNNPEQAHIAVVGDISVWDDGYPSGGNYWSDLVSQDLYSGSFQNETGSDGIADSTYVIDSHNLDHYPLVGSGIQNPSMDTMITTLYFSPDTMDPARCYTLPTVELMLNVYEPLIFFDREKIEQFVPRLASNWSVSADGLTYTFEVRNNVRFHDNVVLTTEDVEYSLERLLVIEGEGAWMFYEAFFNTYGSQDSIGSFIVSSQQIDDAITRNDSTVTLHLEKPYAPLLQALSMPFASVLSKNWCLQLGDWPQTWDNWTSYNKPAATAIELQATAPPGPRLNAMCGTGPFMFDYYVTSVEWSIVKFDDYWGGWPAPGCTGFLQRILSKTPGSVGCWENRKSMFLNGCLDSALVPTADSNSILGQSGIRCIYPLPTLACDELFFTFDIAASSPYLGVAGGLPEGTFNESGIPCDFFNDINVRKGFAYAFNFSTFREDVFPGELYQPATPIIPGLPFYNVAQEKYAIDLAKAEAYLREAWNGELWSNGFNVTIPYTNPYRQKAGEILKMNIEKLNPKFHVDVQPIGGASYHDAAQAHELPIFIYGWNPDFADPHNLAIAFMYSTGYYAKFQNYCNETIDELVRAGIAETRELNRRDIYFELQRLYHEECPGFPLTQVRARRFERDWVRGWYYNSLLAGLDYFYVQWKEYAPAYPVNVGENTVDAINSSDTIVFINSTCQGNLTITSTDINLDGTITEGIEAHYLKCVTVDTTIPHENITFPIEVRVYFKDEEVISAYVGQSSLHMYYWNGTGWLLENDTGVVAPSDILGYAGYVWARIYHLSLFAPLGNPSKRNVAVTYIRTPKTVTGQGSTLTVNVTLENQLDSLEMINVTIYANASVIGALSNIVLPARSSLTVSFPWNTTGVALGNYTISAYAWPVPGDVDTRDNNRTDGSILVTKVGDFGGGVPPAFFNCDGSVDGKDLALFLQCYKGTAPAEAMYLGDLGGGVPPQFYDCDGKVDGKDLALFLQCFKGLGP